MKHVIPVLPDSCNGLLRGQLNIISATSFTPPTPLGTLMFLINQDINIVHEIIKHSPQITHIEE